MKIALTFFILALFVSSVIGQELAATEPKIIKIPQAAIPREAVESGLGGKVRVQIQLDSAGNVIAVESVLGPDSVCSSVTRADVVALREAARTAAMDAKYEPGAAVRTWLSFDFPRKEVKETKSEEIWVKGGQNYEVVPPKDPNKYTVKGDINFSASAEPPPDYTGPVNTGASAVRSSGPLPKTLSGGVLNGKAISLPKPPYPPAARAVRASGAVSVRVLIEHDGKVFSAAAVSGHPLLRAASVAAACQAEFTATQLMGQPVKVNGVITYNFVP